MPRFRRVIHPNTLIHLIVRFHNHDDVLDSDEARAEYLTRVGRYFSKSDWWLLSYALMSTHVHLGVIAGAAPLASITKPINGSFAHWLKRSGRRRRLGHVVASRPSSKELPLSAARNLIAYHHNNPVKAGVVAQARDSSWTSHRSYIRGESQEWLHVELGLALCDLGTSKADRRRFDKMVGERVGIEMPDHDEEFKAHRCAARAHLGSAVEIGSPRLMSTGQLIADAFMPPNATIHSVWPGSLHQLVILVVNATDIAARDILSRSRRRVVVRARRLFVLCAHVELHRSIGEVAATVGISSPAARQLEQHATTEERLLAAALADSARRLLAT